MCGEESFLCDGEPNQNIRIACLYQKKKKRKKKKNKIKKKKKKRKKEK
jgi:hypothetical protein